MTNTDLVDATGPPSDWWGSQRCSAPLGIRPDGRVAVTSNRYAKLPRYHFDVTCPGLENANWDLQDTRTFRSVSEMFEQGIGRPCRACALEPALIRYLRSPHTRASKRRATVPGRLAVVTFSSQSNPNEANPYKYRYREATPSGAERLVRVARELDLPVVDTAAGPVTWTRLTTTAADALGKNLRTIVAPPHVELPEPTTIQALWSMLVTSPPEIDGWTSEVWDLADAVVA